MNRTGLFIALALALIVGFLFGIFPELDLKLAALFYDAASKSFPLKLNTLAAFARDAAMWIAWALALPAIVALVVKLVRPDRPLLIPGRAIVFLLVTLLLSAGILTNLTFKSYWGRPRPVVVTQFNGPQEFVPWWDPRGSCGRNCSFFSGEGATAFWTYAPAALTPPAWRPLAYAAATLFGDHDQRAADGVWRAFLHRRRDRGARDIPGDLARLCLHLPLAVDPAVRRADRCRADPAGLAGLPAAPAAGGGREIGPDTFDVSDFIAPAAIKCVPIGAKFDIRALKPQNDISYFDRLEAL